MAEIYAVSKEVPAPALDFKDLNAYQYSIEKYTKSMEAYIRGLGYAEPETGKVIRFPVADGYAEYMVISVKNPQLVHLEVGDCYSFQYAHLLGSKEIKEELEKASAWAKIFKKK